MKILTIHGIGDGQPDYSEKWNLKYHYPDATVVPFYYEDLNDKSWKAKLTRFATKAILSRYGLASAGDKIEDYALDILTFFLNKDIRNAIMARLHKTIIDEMPDVIIGHSLGSVIGYIYCYQHPIAVEELITIGSPLGSGITTKKCKIGMGYFVKVLVKSILGTKVLQEFSHTTWQNVCSKMDPISGLVERDYGCFDQYEIPLAGKVTHTNVTGYLDFVKLSQ
jgi:hypothetical protein